MKAHTWILMIALTLAAAPGLQAQHADEPETPVVSLDAIRMETFAPKHLSPGELYQIARMTVGRSVYVRERGGEWGEPVSNLALMSDRILVYDESKIVDLILEALARLDTPVESVGIDASMVTHEYAPRFVSLHAASDALRQFDTRGNIALVNERNLLILRDSSARAEQMLGVLRSVDVPKPQAMLTCYLVRTGEGGAGGVKLPTELTKSLEALAPGMSFRGSGFGMLRTSISAGNEVGLRLEAEDATYELSFRTAAYDKETESLTVEKCRLDREIAQRFNQSGMVVERVEGKRSVFTTNALMRGGEYTVLGASGADPVFLVLYLKPLD